MQPKTYIVRKNPLFIRYAPFNLAKQNISYFSKPTKFVKISKIPYMPFIICKYLIKNSITILKTTCMNRQNQNASLKHRYILNKKAIGIGNA